VYALQVMQLNKCVFIILFAELGSSVYEKLSFCQYTFYCINCHNSLVLSFRLTKS